MDTSIMSAFRFNTNSSPYLCLKGYLFIRYFFVLTIGAQLLACQNNKISARVINATPSSVNNTYGTELTEDANLVQRHDDLSMRVNIRLEELTGTLESIDRRGNRFIILMDDGKLIRLGMPKSSLKNSTLKPGQRIGFSLKESVEIIRNKYQHEVYGHAVAREAPGSSGERENYNSYYNRGPIGHQSRRWVEVIDVPAKVVNINPQRSQVVLKTNGGRLFTVGIMNNGIDISEMSFNESVIARFEEINEIFPIE